MQHISNQVETWKPVVGWEDYLEVSDHGRVRSLDRITVGIEGKEYRFKGKLRNPNRTKFGYLRMQLRHNGRESRAFVHEIVLEAFVGPRPRGMEACHNDGDRTNNSLNNLRWDDRSGNVEDMVRHGTHNMARVTHCPRGHAHSVWNCPTYVFRQGRRSCLACQRAHSYTRRNPHLKPMFQEVSDRYYQQIVAEQ